MKTASDGRSALRMSLPARAENVAVVRHALAGLAERLGMDEAAIANLKTVVTEACMNVVVHAYPDGEAGPLQVEGFVEDEGLMVAVRDWGTGIQPRRALDRSSLRLGLSLIAALSSSFEIGGGVGQGTEITMHLPLRSAEGERDGEAPPRPLTAAEERTELRVGPSDFVAPVLSRVLAALAARQGVDVDRRSDAMLLSDAISAGAPRGFGNNHVSVSILERGDGVELRIGPMQSGGAEQLRESLEIPELGSLEILADGIGVDAVEEGEFLVLGIVAPAA
jgi:serine/threonine-protein kinase RsbW